MSGGLSMEKEIDHFVYDGKRLPKSGEYYGYFGVMGEYSIDFRIHEAIIDFENYPQHIYLPVYKEVTKMSLADRFDEWNW
jgi:hypothetical protein